MALRSTVKTLSEKTDGFSKQCAPQTQFSGNMPPLDHNTPNRHILVSSVELREMQDKERRKESIILRRLPDLEVSEAQSKIKELS